MKTIVSTTIVNWPDKSVGFYVQRANGQWLTPQGGWSNRYKSTMFETAQAAELAASLRCVNFTVVHNQGPV